MIEIRHSRILSSNDSRLAYEDIHQERKLHQLDSFYLWLLDLLDPKPEERLLDVACGKGILVNLARRRGVIAYGIDLSNVAISHARKNGEGGFLIGDGSALPFPNEIFDCVTSIGSLEHYLDPSSGVREIRRVLRSGGKACILLPNTFSLTGNIVYAWRYGDVFDDGQPIQRYNTRRGWQKLLEENALNVMEVIKYEATWPRTWADWWWYLIRPIKICHLLVGSVIPLHLANCIVYICKRS